MAATIGIKIANGEFYPVLEENSSIKRRLILTTVHDAQKSVQIDLYKSVTKTMAGALYIGSLVIEKISSKPRGAPSVELTISSNSSGEIIADAVDLDTQGEGHGEHYHLNISLASLDEDGRDITIPDFELESYADPPDELYDRTGEVSEKDNNRRLPLILIIGGAVVIVLWLGIWFFLTKGAVLERLIPGFGRPAVTVPAPEPPVEAAPLPAAPPPPPVKAPAPPVAAAVPEPAVPVKAAAPVEPPAAAPKAETPEPVKPAAPKAEAAPEPVPPVKAAEPVVIEAPAKPKVAVPARSRERDAPVARYKVPTTIPPGGVPYKIQWGDTLWEISEAFYRNPWLYARIARFNNIRNPNRIISGTTIRIPPRN